MKKIIFNNIFYEIKNEPIKIGDTFINMIYDNEKLKNIIINTCLDEKSSKFNNDNESCFKIIKTDHPLYKHLYEADKKQST